MGLLQIRELPNFCYRCGLLNHALKDCANNQDQSKLRDDNQLQYGAWLRGELVRHGGMELNKQGNGGVAMQRLGPSVDDTVKPSELIKMVKEALGFGKSHVPDTIIQDDSYLT